ncbi:peptide chain release factor N(5)-glutamine methyltransferase [Aureibacillus halotolerans]|uniref:Release factor glutamine methyltransferase n=1 Tax=Aureibacillus halotolerans TaxID=1508390 RepID=A0A4R6U2S9_9BACI|nr:peptide chain release factor N(5)-glutamine methyltransferase [Aureibacillus halotolerans]TDQ38749.1 release factor glutamine methyltransferase [Aureibacillus halotolerans]
MTLRTIDEVLRKASFFLRQHQREERVAEWLCMHVLQMDRAKLLASLRDPMPENTQAQLDELLHQHAKGQPLQYLTGQEQFLGRTFSVTPDVLIPRPETEELVMAVEEAIKDVFPGPPATIVDIGTGSGIIAVSLAGTYPHSSVLAVDISADAIAIAKQNAARHNAHIDFHHGSLLSPFIEKGETASVIVSNPPYISQKDWEGLEETVRQYEPKQALIGGDRGVELYEQIASQLPSVLEKPGIAAFEIGYDQGASVSKIMQEAMPHASVRCLQDMNHRDRIVMIVQ